MKLLQWFSATALVALSLTGSLQAANTVQDFTAIFPPGAGQAPPILTVSSDAANPPRVVEGWDGNALRLTQDGVGGLNNGVSFNQVGSGAFEQIDFKFDFRVWNEDGGGDADGFGFTFANSANFGENNSSGVPNWPTMEEPELAGSLGIGFDTWSNQGLDGTPDGTLPNSISLHWDSARIESMPLGDLGVADDWFQTGIKQANISLTSAGRVSVTVKDLDTNETITPWTNVAIDGFSPYDGRVAFRARTGGENSNHELDNISITRKPTGGAAVTTVLSNFEGFAVDEPISIEEGDPPVLVGGTPFVTTQAGAAPGPRIINDGNGAGQQPGHLQLTEESGSLHNFVAFDKTSDNATKINATFDVRLRDANGNFADGMSFVLASTSEFGDSGPIVDGGAYWNPAEEANLAGSLGLSFDTFNNDNIAGSPEDPEGCPDPNLQCEEPGNSSRRANHVSLHWDGAPAAPFAVLDQAELNLVGNSFHTVNVQYEETAQGALVTVVMTDGTDGSIHVLYDNVLIPGAKYTQSARAAFGARTGGAMDFQAVDNINIAFGDGGIKCDFDGNGTLNVADIDALRNAIRTGAGGAAFDVNGDNVVNLNDLTSAVSAADCFNTYVGDANLDGQFNSGDLVTVFAAGEYEDTTALNSTWAEGDWNADGDFNTGDLVFAFQGGGYEVGPRAAVSAVPEPSSLALLSLGALFLIRRRK